MNRNMEKKVTKLQIKNIEKLTNLLITMKETLQIGSIPIERLMNSIAKMTKYPASTCRSMLKNTRNQLKTKNLMMKWSSFSLNWINLKKVSYKYQLYSISRHAPTF